MKKQLAVAIATAALAAVSLGACGGPSATGKTKTSSALAATTPATQPPSAATALDACDHAYLFMTNVSTLQEGGSVSSSTMASNAAIASSYGSPVSTDVSAVAASLKTYINSPTPGNSEALDGAIGQLDTDCNSLLGT